MYLQCISWFLCNSLNERSMSNQSAEKVMGKLSHTNWAVKHLLVSRHIWMVRVYWVSFIFSYSSKSQHVSKWKGVFPPPKYHIPAILTLLPYALKLCIRAVGGTLDVFFHVAQSGHIKISVTNQTQGIYCVIRRIQQLKETKKNVLTRNYANLN